MTEVAQGKTWWVEAAYKLGVPSLIAIILVWAMAYRFDGKLDEVNNNLKLHTIDSAYIIKNTTEMKHILLRICVNTAEDQTELNECFPSQ